MSVRPVMRKRGRRLIAAAALCCASASIQGSSVQTVDRYIAASINDAGDLRIVAANGVATTIRKGAGEVGIGDIRISPAGDAVGWVGIQKNCCTSYDIPSSLYVYTAGRTRKYEGNGLPVWKWTFSASGREAFFYQATVHGATGEHYELRDVGTGRLISEFSPAVGRDNRPLPAQVLPEWVKAFM
jgi:hypothetical protein